MLTPSKKLILIFFMYEANIDIVGISLNKFIIKISFRWGAHYRPMADFRAVAEAFDLSQQLHARCQVWWYNPEGVSMHYIL